MKRQTIPSTGEGTKQLLFSLLVGTQNGAGMKMVWQLGKTIWEFLTKLIIHLSYDPTIPLLREIKHMPSQRLVSNI